MSQSPRGPSGAPVNPHIFAEKQAKDCLLPMVLASIRSTLTQSQGITSENVAAEFKVSRQEQDELAVLSHARAAAAIKAGRFKEEV